jgi:hypothetical protein
MWISLKFLSSSMASTSDLGEPIARSPILYILHERLMDTAELRVVSPEKTHVSTLFFSFLAEVGEWRACVPDEVGRDGFISYTGCR